MKGLGLMNSLVVLLVIIGLGTVIMEIQSVELFGAMDRSPQMTVCGDTSDNESCWHFES